jgi:integrase
MTFRPGDNPKPKITSAKMLERLTEPGRYPDSQVPGLGLQVTSATRRSWVLRFQMAKKPRHLGLGPFPEVGLSVARQKAREAREKIREGIDPIAERADRRAAHADATQKKIVTFKEAAERFYAAKSGEWKTEQQRRTFLSTMRDYVYPIIGNMDVAAVDLQAILRVLSPIWETKPTVANLLRIRLEKILTHAQVSGYRTGDNPARWNGNLAVILPAHGKIRTVKHHAAMPYKAVPAFMARLREQEGVAAAALEFLILTGARVAEVCGLTWGEIDREEGVWTVPAHRMKAGRIHVVPLSNAAMAVLEKVAPLSPRREGDAPVFAGRKAGQGIIPHTVATFLRDTMGVTKEEATRHGFRSSLKDWAGDETDFHDEISEITLAHKVGDATRNTYRRSPALQKRRALLEQWARYCGGETGDVIQFRGRGK